MISALQVNPFNIHIVMVPILSGVSGGKKRLIRRPHDDIALMMAMSNTDTFV